MSAIKPRTKIWWLKVLLGVALLSGGTFLVNQRLTSDDSCTLRIDSPSGVPNQRCVVFDRADTLEKQQGGLSYRESLPQARGLLFVYDELGERCMWMKDMRFSIDIIWLDEDYEVTTVTKDVHPDTFPQSFCGQGKYVIEVNAGVANQAGVQVRDKLPL